MPLGLVILNVVDDTTLKIVLGISVLIATALLARRLDLAHVGAGHSTSHAGSRPACSTPRSARTVRRSCSTSRRGRSRPTRSGRRSRRSSCSATCSPWRCSSLDGKVTDDAVRAALVAAPAWLLGQALGWPTPQARARRALPVARAHAAVRRRHHGDRVRRDLTTVSNDDRPTRAIPRCGSDCARSAVRCRT